MKLKISLKTNIMLIISMAVLAISMISGSYIVFSNMLDATYRAKVSESAHAYISNIDVEELRSLADLVQTEEYQAMWQEAWEKNDEQMIVDYLESKGLYDVYERLSAKSVQMADDLDVAYIYAQIFMGKEQMYVTDAGDGILYLGYTEPTDPAYWDYDDNVTIPAKVATVPEGTFCSGAEPVVDKDGDNFAIVSVDVNMNDVVAERRAFLYRIIGVSCIIIIAATLICVMLARRMLTAPLEELSKKTKVFAEKEGEYTKADVIHIDNPSKDEVGDLYQEIRNMQGNLIDYMDNIKKVTAEKERIGAELNVATKIQKDMLPCIFPAFPERPEIDVYATMDPAKEVGGDFYDFFMVDEDHVALVIADVSSKGVPAALFMVIAKTLIKNQTQYGHNVAEVFSIVNNQLCEGNDEGMFVTAFTAVINVKTGHMVYANAGHEPFLYRHDGEWQWIRPEAGFILAGLPDFPYKSAEMNLSPGDRLFMFTDGVSEAQNIENELFGEDRITKSILAHGDGELSGVPVMVRADIDEFVGEAPQFDDITMLVFEYRGVE